MDEIKERKCIICQKELNPSRELTCSPLCSRKYKRVFFKIQAISIRDKPKKCLLCDLDLEIQNDLVCNNCQDTFKRIKEYFFIKKEDNGRTKGDTTGILGNT